MTPVVSGCTEDAVASQDMSEAEYWYSLFSSLDMREEGWVDEDGLFLPCEGCMDHNFVARMVLDGGEQEAYSRNWVKVTPVMLVSRGELNGKQKSTLFCYCRKFSIDYLKFLNLLDSP